MSVELFELVFYKNRNGEEKSYWNYTGCIYDGMHASSRDLLTETINKNSNEEMIEKFVWGYCDETYYGPTLSQSCKDTVTKLSFSTLNKNWMIAIGENILPSRYFTPGAIVCLATGE